MKCLLIFFCLTIVNLTKLKASAKLSDKISLNSTGIMSVDTLLWSSCTPNGVNEITRTWWRSWEEMSITQNTDGFFYI